MRYLLCGSVRNSARGVPAVRRRCSILRIGQVRKPLQWRLVRKREGAVLHKKLISLITVMVLQATHRRSGDKVRELDDLAGMRIDERLEPRARVLVLDLDNVCQDDRAVRLGDVFEGGRVLVVLSRERIFGFGDRVLGRDRPTSGRDRCCSGTQVSIRSWTAQT